MRLSTSNVKQLCSMLTRIYAEKKYKDPVQLYPQPHSSLYTQHLPKVGALIPALGGGLCHPFCANGLQAMTILKTMAITCLPRLAGAIP